ncbi:MAG: large subunit ribosomal protein L19 [Salibacteraceae bacterium]|jgi:large subunit ribosomal protein L19
MNPKVQQAATSNVEIAELPSFKAGDTIIVNYKIKEGAKERVQPFQGVVLKRTGKGSTGTFTVRKISNGIGIERIFPISSPFIEAIKVTKVGVVRRSKIYYLRERTGKAARIKEKRR